MSTTRNLIVHGYRLAERRLDLALLLWAFGFIPALAAALPVFFRLDTVLSPTGFAKTLARGFDLVLWSDVAQQIGSLPDQIGSNVMWLILFTLLWNPLSRAGLAWALRGDNMGARLAPPSTPTNYPLACTIMRVPSPESGSERGRVRVGAHHWPAKSEDSEWGHMSSSERRSFWRGVATGGLRALGISFLVLPVAFLLALIGAAAVMGIVALFPSEKGMYWIVMLLMPLVGLVLGSYLVMARSYAVYGAVIDRQRLRSALATGLAWPFRHPESIAIHLAWLLAAAVLTLLPFLLELSLTAGTTVGLVTLTLLQQAALLARAFVLVAWTASEVSLYESNGPVIAHEAPIQS